MDMKRNEQRIIEIHAREILVRIDREGITPRPRWHFLAREGAVWSLGIASVAVGALAVAGILYEIGNARWETYEATHASLLTFTVDALPFVWLTLVCVFIVSAFYFVRTTRRGYRYSLPLLIIGSVTISGVLGGVIMWSGAGQFVDEEIGEYVPFHAPLALRERERWLSLQEGRVSGIVREVSYVEPLFLIEGANQEVYTVIMSLRDEDKETLRMGEYVRVVGIPTTTADMLEGCVAYLRDNDVLRHFHLSPSGFQPLGGAPERKIVATRTSKCKDIRPYASLNE